MEVINKILDDYSDYCDQKLTSEFGPYTKGKYDPIYLYQRYKCRIIESRPRIVLESKNLKIPDLYQFAYEEILSDIQSGSSVKKYQSRNLKKLDYDDDMLSHWGIQHLHLSNAIEADGFVQRTKHLLFIHFSKAEAHIIGIYPHGAWSNVELIEIIHQNWPQELICFKFNSEAKQLSEKDYKTLRMKHANANITVNDGTEYLPPGLGVTANGAPIYAVFNSDNVIFNFNRAFELISENISEILKLDPLQRNSDTLTIGMNIVPESRIIVYHIKETGFSFTL